MSGDTGAVTTVGRDDFFNDPFFKDWWADFDLPLAGAGRQLDRQISGKKTVFLMNLFLNVCFLFVYV